MNPTLRQSSSVRRSWWSIVAIFLLHGLVVSTWVSRIPAVQTNLHLNNAVLGLTLLSLALGALAAIPLAGMLIARYGSKRITRTASLLFCCALVPPSFAVNALTLGIALFVFGATAASMDVAMNAQGVEVEKKIGSPTMSRFHAMFSIGAMIGAGAGGFVASHAVPVKAHFAASAAIYFIAVIIASAGLLPSQAGSAETAHRLPLKKIPPVLIALCAIGFCVLLSEGAMADWTAVYMKQTLRAGPGVAAAGYSVFSAAMAVFRLAGDWITLKLRPERAVRLGSLLAGVGLLTALCAQSALWALPGFACTGAGLSIIVPLVFGSGGRIPNVSPGPGIATVTGLGYAGFIVGPPAIGLLAQILTLRFALGLVVLCCFVSAALSRALYRLNPASGAAPEPA